MSEASCNLKYELQEIILAVGRLLFRSVSITRDTSYFNVTCPIFILWTKFFIIYFINYFHYFINVNHFHCFTLDPKRPGSAVVERKTSERLHNMTFGQKEDMKMRKNNEESPGGKR